MADLTNNSKLQIIIVPSGQNYTSPTGEDITGKLIFREGSNTIEVNGHEYKASSTADLTAIINALKNTGYLTQGNDGTLTAQNPGTVAALLGTKIATASGEGVNTVSGWIESLQGSISDINDSISTINTNITNLQNATKTDGNSNFVVRDKTGEGTTDFANTTAIQTAINTAKTTAEQNAATDATNRVNTAKSELIGGTNNDTSSDPGSTSLNPGENKTWAAEEIKTLSHLKDLILNLQGQIGVITGTNFNDIATAINAIEQELVDGEGGLTTVIDALKVFIGSGLTSENGPSYTVNNTTQTTLSGIISQLETKINTVDDKHSVVTDGVGGNATAGSTNYAVVTSSTSDGQTTYTVQTTSALDTVASNASSALSTANAALPKGGSLYTTAAALEAGLKGNSSTDTMNSTTIEGAKKYADNAATTAANAVISWEVIGQNNSTGS